MDVLSNIVVSSISYTYMKIPITDTDTCVTKVSLFGNVPSNFVEKTKNS